MILQKEYHQSMQNPDREDEHDGGNLVGDMDNDDNTSRVSNLSLSDLLRDVFAPVKFEGSHRIVVLLKNHRCTSRKTKHALMQENK